MLGVIEKQFQPLFKFAAIGAAITNKEGSFIQSNQAFQELFGYTEEELNPLFFSQLTHPEDRAESRQLFEELFSGQRTSFIQKNRYFRKDGRLLWGDISVNAVCNANRFPQYALATIQTSKDVGEELHLYKQAYLDLNDAYTQVEKRLIEETGEHIKANTCLQEEITKRQKIEATLESQQAFLQTLINLYPGAIFAKGSFAVVTDASTLEAMESELQQAKEQLRAVLDAMPGFVAWIDCEGKYLGVNQYMANCFNLSPDDFVGQDLSFLKNSTELVDFMTQFVTNSASTSRQEILVNVNGTSEQLFNYCSEVPFGFPSSSNWN